MPDVEIDVTFPDPVISNVVVDKIGPSGGSLWGTIGGTLSNQTDLQSSIDTKVPTSRTVNSKGLSSNITLSPSDLSMSTSRLLGRTTSSTGSVEEISVGTGLILSAGTLTSTGSGLSFTPPRIFNVKDYGAVGNGSHDDSTGIQAAIDACDTVGGGEVYFPSGTYRINSGLIVGTLNTSLNGRNSNIALVGESLLTSVIQYHGSSSGIAIQFNKNKYSHMERLRISNLTGARSTTTGLETSGPDANGTDSNGHIFQNLIIEGFHWGLHTSAGVTATGPTASELTAINVDFTDCDAGVYNLNFNALNINLINCAFSANAYGVQAGTAGVYIHGGAGSGNTSSTFIFTGGGTYAVNNFRDETSAAFIQISIGSTTGQLFVSNCLTTSLALTGLYNAAMYISGSKVEINSSIIDGPIKVNDNGNGTPTDISVVNCKVKDTRPFYTTVAGIHYRIRGCVTYSSDVNTVTAFPNSEGVSIAGPAYKDWVNEPINGGSALLTASSVIHTGVTITNLPGSPTAGEVAYITDGDASLAWGATAINTGSGATKYLVWYNGTNWTIAGK